MHEAMRWCRPRVLRILLTAITQRIMTTDSASSAPSSSSSSIISSTYYSPRDVKSLVVHAMSNPTKSHHSAHANGAEATPGAATACVWEMNTQSRWSNPIDVMTDSPYWQHMPPLVRYHLVATALDFGANAYNGWPYRGLLQMACYYNPHTKHVCMAYDMAAHSSSTQQQHTYHSHVNALMKACAM